MREEIRKHITEQVKDKVLDQYDEGEYEGEFLIKQAAAVVKAKKVALVACMRRLLTIINAMLRDRTPWTEALAASQT